MGSPEHCYKTILSNYIQNSFKFDNNLRKKYNSNYLYSLDIVELETIVKNINKDNKIYNAFMAGANIQSYIDEACNDECNAIMGFLNRYLNLFEVNQPDKTNFCQGN